MKRILDYGCGTGYRSEILGKTNDYSGVDIDGDNIRQARKTYPGSDFRKVDGRRIPFNDGYFDEIHSYDVLEHVRDIQGVIREMSRCLKPGGKLIVEVPDAGSEERLKKIHPSYWKEIGHVRCVTDAVIAPVAKKFGFRIVKKGRKKGIENILLGYFYKSGGKIMKETGNFTNANPLLIRLSLFFSEDFFKTGLFRKLFPLWIVFPVWLLTIPAGHLLSLFWPKTIRYELVKNS